MKKEFPPTITKASELYKGERGYIVDTSGGLNPRPQYWRFSNRSKAELFVSLLETYGETEESAAFTVYNTLG